MHCVLSWQQDFDKLEGSVTPSYTPAPTPRTHTSYNHTYGAVQMHKNTRKAFSQHIKQKIDYKAFGSKMVILISLQEISESYLGYPVRTPPHRHIHTSHIRCCECAIVHTYRNKRPRIKHLISSNEWHSMDQMGPCDYPNQSWRHAY